MKIAIGGKARAGKDTVTGIIHGLGVTNMYQFTFARPLYACTQAVQSVLGRRQEKDPALLQLLGEGLRQHYGENIFVEAVEKMIIYHNDPSVMISDLRYKNEFAMLRKHEFVTIRVIRPNRPIDRDPNHKSEIDLDDTPFDYEIVNDGDLEQLKIKTKLIYDEILAKSRT